MANDLEELKRKRDQAIARVQQAEARLKANTKQEDDRVKILVGAAILDHHKRTGSLPGGELKDLLSLMDGFLTRQNERKAVLGADQQGSEALRRVIGIQGAEAKVFVNQVLEHDKGCKVEAKFNWRKEWAQKSKLETPKNRLPRGVAEA